MSFWIKSGTNKLVINSTGKLVNCEDCPCGEELDISLECGICLNGISRCWSITIEGVTGSGNCTAANGTHIIDMDRVPNEHVIFVCQGASPIVSGTTYQWVLYRDSTLSKWNLVWDGDANFGDSALAFYELPDADFNCLGETVFSKTSDSCGGSFPATVTITPVACI